SWAESPDASTVRASRAMAWSAPSRRSTGAPLTDSGVSSRKRLGGAFSSSTRPRWSSTITPAWIASRTCRRSRDSGRLPRRADRRPDGRNECGDAHFLSRLATGGTRQKPRPPPRPWRAESGVGGTFLPMRTGLSVEEARKVVLEAAPLLEPERVPSQDALGRVLAEAIHSTRTLPPADCSAMDGYAGRAADLAGASPAAPLALPVPLGVAAGGRGARRIFTGAPRPEGADAVVMKEHVEASDEGVRFRAPARRGDHVRPAGEDVRAGDLGRAPGTPIGPAESGL